MRVATKRDFLKKKFNRRWAGKDTLRSLNCQDDKEQSLERFNSPFSILCSLLLHLRLSCDVRKRMRGKKAHRKKSCVVNFCVDKKKAKEKKSHMKEWKCVIDKFSMIFFLPTIRTEHWTLYHIFGMIHSFHFTPLSLTLSLLYLFAIFTLLVYVNFTSSQQNRKNNVECHTLSIYFELNFQNWETGRKGKKNENKGDREKERDVFALYLIKFFLLFTFNWHKRIGLQFLFRYRSDSLLSLTFFLHRHRYESQWSGGRNGKVLFDYLHAVKSELNYCHLQSYSFPFLCWSFDGRARGEWNFILFFIKFPKRGREVLFLLLSQIEIITFERERWNAF